MRTLIAIGLLFLPALAQAQEAQDVSDIDDLLREHPQDVQLRLDRAESLLDEGRFDEALVDCDLAAALAPGDPAISLTRGRIHLAMGELGLAEVYLTKYLEQGPATISVFLLRGGIREETGRFSEALADYDRARKMAKHSNTRSLGDLLELIEIEEGRARSFEQLHRIAEAKTARAHAEQLRLLTAIARRPRDT